MSKQTKTMFRHYSLNANTTDESLGREGFLTRNVQLVTKQWQQCGILSSTHTYTHTCLMAFYPGQPG